MTTTPRILLTPEDFEGLAKRRIPADLAARAGIDRVDNQTGAQMVGRRTSLIEDFSGVVIPNYWPGERTPREYRLRRDHPSLELEDDGTVKERGKYLGPPGRGNRLYFPPDTFIEHLENPAIPAVITEGEFKSLALWQMSSELDVSWLCIGLQGVWSWRGVVAKQTDEHGRRVGVKGPIPDLRRVEWADRVVYIAFDADVETNEKVRVARSALAQWLARQGAKVYFVEIPEIDGASKVDDLLYLKGVDFVHELFKQAVPAPEWIRRASEPQPELKRDWRRLVREAREREDGDEPNLAKEMSHMVDALSFTLSAAGVPERFRSYLDALVGASNGELGWFKAPDAFVGMRARTITLHPDPDEEAVLVEPIKKETMQKWVQRARKDFDEWQKAAGITIVESQPGGKNSDGYNEPTRYRLPCLDLAARALEQARLDPEFQERPHRAIRRAARDLLKDRRYDLLTPPRRERFRRPAKTAESYRKMCLTYAGKCYRAHFTKSPERAERELEAIAEAIQHKEFDVAELGPKESINAETHQNIGGFSGGHQCSPSRPHIEATNGRGGLEGGHRRLPTRPHPEAG